MIRSSLSVLARRFLGALGKTSANVVVGLLVVASTEGHAALIQLNSAASLSPGDATLIYGQSPGTVLSSPVSYTVGGNTVTFSDTGGTFEVDQVGVNYSFSAFSNGTKLLGVGGFQGPQAPLTIKFTNAVTEFGFNAEEFVGGAYTVSFIAYDGATPLGTFTANGNDPTSLSFEGAKATGGDVITSIVVSDNRGNDLLLGPLTFGPSAATSIPEPTSLTLLCAGLIGLTLAASRRTRR